MNDTFGFLGTITSPTKGELTAKFGTKDGELLWEAFNSAFDWLSPAALVGGKILCMHGGIGNNGLSDLCRPGAENHRPN